MKNKLRLRLKWKLDRHQYYLLAAFTVALAGFTFLAVLSHGRFWTCGETDLRCMEAARAESQVFFGAIMVVMAVMIIVLFYPVIKVFGEKVSMKIRKVI